jgi:hypothetical protein
MTLAKPTISIAYTAATKPYVGMANARPDSFTPRRFMTLRTTTNPIERPTAWGASDGTALVMAATPATTETATVST